MINGDNIKGFWERVVYFAQCIINHYRGSKNSINIKKVTLDPAKVHNFKGAPSRILCGLFWGTVDWSSISKSLDAPLYFFDIGCGKGNYSKYTRDLTADCFGSYVGLDIYKADSFPPEFEHILSDAVYADEHLPKETNIIVSQSALEHIKEDVLMLEKLTSKLSSRGQKFFQIHMIPAPSSLWLYLWHGWRQYSKKNLSSIEIRLKKINPNVEIFAIPLGGGYSFLTHLFRITMPLLIFKLKDINKRPYILGESPLLHERISNAVKKDLLSRSSKYNSFWVLVISSKDTKLELS